MFFRFYISHILGGCRSRAIQIFSAQLISINWLLIGANSQSILIAIKVLKAINSNFNGKIKINFQLIFGQLIAQPPCITQ